MLLFSSFGFFYPRNPARRCCLAGKLKIGISSCLLRHEVRWNGGHKLHKFLVYTLKRWQDILAAKPAMGALVDFHTRNKLLILAHSQNHYRKMGRLVAAGGKMPIRQLYDRYQLLLMDALKLKTTIRKNTNVLQHLMGYFKKQLTPDEKQELLEIFEQYRNELVPLILLINHYVRKYDQPYLKLQTYLNSSPIELKLRTHV